MIGQECVAVREKVPAKKSTGDDNTRKVSEILL